MLSHVIEPVGADPHPTKAEESLLMRVLGIDGEIFLKCGGDGHSV